MKMSAEILAVLREAGGPVPIGVLFDRVGKADPFQFSSALVALGVSRQVHVCEYGYYVDEPMTTEPPHPHPDLPLEGEGDARAEPTRAAVLERAAQVVARDRCATHGQPEQSFAVIADLWSVYLGQPLMPHDVAALMSLLKVARIRTSPAHADNWVDLAGYAACGAEVAGVEPGDG